MIFPSFKGRGRVQTDARCFRVDLLNILFYLAVRGMGLAIPVMQVKMERRSIWAIRWREESGLRNI